MKHLLTFLFTSIFLVLIIPMAGAQVTPDTIAAQDTIQTVAPATTSTPAPAPAATAAAPAPKPPKEKKARTPLRKKLYFGGSVGATFGSYTMIGLYPMLGYKFTPKLSGGLKFSYQYYKYRDYDQSTSNYGGSIFARYRIIPPLYVHIEYEMINYEFYQTADVSERTLVPFLFLGAGYSRHIGGGAWIYGQVLFDVLQNENSPYSSWDPFFSVGVSVGF